MLDFIQREVGEEIGARVFIVSTDTALPYWMRPDKGFVPAIDSPCTSTYALRMCGLS